MAMICEICGSTDLVKQDGFFVCQSCGTKYTVEEARKLLGDAPTTDFPPAPLPRSSRRRIRSLKTCIRSRAAQGTTTTAKPRRNITT